MTYPIGMTCQELVELVSDYLEDALGEDERARFELHLSVCPGCVEYVDQMRLTVRAAGRLDEEALEPRVRDELMRVFQSWKQTT